MKTLLVHAVILATLAAAALAGSAPPPSRGPYSDARTNAAPRARVVVVEDRAAIEAFRPRPEAVDALFHRGLARLTGEADSRAAWRRFVSERDVIGIKVVSAPGGSSGTRSAVVAALVRGLLDAGIPAGQIHIWDKRVSDLRRAGFGELAERFGVQLAGAADEGYDGDEFYEVALLGKLVWGDHDFNRKNELSERRSYLTRLLTRKFTKIINVTPLLNHNLAGVAGNLFTLAMDSVDNSIRFESSPEHLAQAVAALYARETVGDKVVLNVVDALLCQYQGEERTLLHYSVMLGQLWFSTDPLALDLLSLREIRRQRERSGADLPRPNLKIYSHSALLELGIADTNRIDVIHVP